LLLRDLGREGRAVRAVSVRSRRGDRGRPRVGGGGKAPRQPDASPAPRGARPSQRETRRRRLGIRTRTFVAGRVVQNETNSVRGPRFSLPAAGKTPSAFG